MHLFGLISGIYLGNQTDGMKDNISVFRIIVYQYGFSFSKGAYL